MLRDLVDSDNPIRRPIIAVAVWAAVLGGWLLLASLAGVWPFAEEPVAGGAGAPAPVAVDATVAAARTGATANRYGHVPNTVAPELPRLYSPSHTAGNVSARPDVEITWTATDSTDNAPIGYAYSWSPVADTQPEPLVLAPGDTVNLVSAPLPNGSWWFHLRAVDREGNWSGTAHLGPFIIQAAATATLAPTAAPTPTPTPSPAPAAAAPVAAPTRVVTVAPPAAPRTATPAPVQATARPTVQPTAAPPQRTAAPPVRTPEPTEPNPDGIRPITPAPSAATDGVRPAGPATQP